MTVESSEKYISYSGNGSNTLFTIPFDISTVLECEVWKVDSSGTLTLQELSTHYYISDDLGDVVYYTAPASTDDIIIQRVPFSFQTLDLQNNTAIDADSLEAILDRLTKSVQSLELELGRTVKVDESFASLSKIAAAGASKYLRFNDSGDGIEAVTLTTDPLAIVSDLTGSTGMVSQTGSSTYSARTLTAGSGISVTNGTGVSGNPTIALSSNPITLAGALTVPDATVDGGTLTITGIGGGSVSLEIDAADIDNVTFKLPTVDGTSGQVLRTNGAGVLSWVANSSTPPSAGGSNTQVQYNSSGTFAGDTGFTTNGAGNLTVTGRLDVDNLRIDGNTISAQNTNGNITFAPAGSGQVTLTGTQTIAGQMNVDNLRLDGNVLSALNSNGNVEISPNGTGKIVLDTLTLTADPGSPTVGQVLACTSLSAGTQITLADNAATSTTYGQGQLYDVAVDGSTSTSTAATQLLTPGGVRSLSCVAQGWVRFNGTGTPAQIDTNYNFSSITDNGNGDYDINFSTNLATNNEFCVSVTGSSTIGYYLSSGSDTNTIHIQMKSDAGTLTDDAHISVIVFGII
jgi:cytoskeletal protein CcmA (bactofilin family)